MLERHGIGPVGQGVARIRVGFHEQARRPRPRRRAASTGTISRMPPLLVPGPPGNCTLWVASNTTGAPFAHDGQAGHVDTRLL